MWNTGNDQWIWKIILKLDQNVKAFLIQSITLQLKINQRVVRLFISANVSVLKNHVLWKKYAFINFVTNEIFEIN